MKYLIIALSILQLSAIAKSPDHDKSPDVERGFDGATAKKLSLQLKKLRKSDNLNKFEFDHKIKTMREELQAQSEEIEALPEIGDVKIDKEDSLEHATFVNCGEPVDIEDEEWEDYKECAGAVLNKFIQNMPKLKLK